MPQYTEHTIEQQGIRHTLLVEHRPENGHLGLGKVVAFLYHHQIPDSNEPWLPTQGTFIVGYFDPSTSTPPDGTVTYTPTVDYNPYFISRDPSFPEGCDATLVQTQPVPPDRAQAIMSTANANHTRYPWLRRSPHLSSHPG